MQAEILRELWNCELKILDEVDRICRKHNLNYYLMWGTLIGAVRHKGFIPWDDDIDISMPREDYDKFLKIAQKELHDNFFVQTAFTDKFHPGFFAKVRLKNTAFYATNDKNIKRNHGIFIDIIPIDGRKEKDSIFRKVKNRLAAKISSYIFKIRNEDSKGGFSIFKIFPQKFLLKLRDWLMKGKGDCCVSWGYRFKKTDFLPVIEMEFEGKKYNAPNNYHKVLTTIYGDYMQLPPEDKRIAHEPAFISFDVEKDNEKLKKYLEALNA